MLGQVQLRKEIAIRLKQARKQIGFVSAEEFCQYTGLPVNEYPRHESGSIALRASQAVQYCKLLHVPLHWLMFGETQLKPAKRFKRRASADVHAKIVAPSFSPCGRRCPKGG